MTHTHTHTHTHIHTHTHTHTHTYIHTWVQANPPEQSPQVTKQRPLLHEYVRALLFGRLSDATLEATLDSLRRLPRNDPTVCVHMRIDRETQREREKRTAHTSDDSAGACPATERVSERE
jgi:hypothetical protein